MKLQEAIELISKAEQFVKPIMNGEFASEGFEMGPGDDPVINDLYKNIAEKLKDISWSINYANTLVVAEGTLQKNDLGYYEFADSGFYLSSNSKVEIYVPKEERYVLTFIVQEESDYYAYGLREVKLEGARARVRMK